MRINTPQNIRYNRRIFAYYTKTDMINKERIILNPFVENHPLQVVAMPRNNVIGNSTELVEPLDKLLTSHYLLDSQDKTSIYRYAKKSIYEIMFGRLTARGRDLFIYIMYSIPKNEDFILLSAKKVRQDIGMSGRTLTDAIKELRESNIINFKSKSVYWVNPYYIFNGNRLEYYRNLSPDNIVIKSILKK